MTVDDRAGSDRLIPLLKARGVKEVITGRLPYGDIEIIGSGPEGRPILVGIEYKKLSDLLQCIDNGRFVGHQLPGMLDSYEQVWLCVEGIWRERSDGIIEVPAGPSWKPIRAGAGLAMASALVGFLLTMENKVGIRVMRTGTTFQTVDWLFHMSRWWTGKEWEEHRAHLAFDNSQALALISRPSLVRRVAKELPGIGMGKSGPVARRFSTVMEMVVAEEEDWVGIEGVGKVMAKRIVKAIQEGEA